MSDKQRRPRILFMAEAVTLAHVARPLVLAQALDAARYEIHFACAPGYEFCFGDVDFSRWPIQSIPSEQFLKALASGSRPYDGATLARYVEEDLSLMDSIHPDLVVGDFRLSLAVSAPLRHIKLATITNAHWSPYSPMKRFPLPDHPLSRLLGAGLGTRLFHMLQGPIFEYHARPLNALRRSHGLPPLGDLRHAYTWGDHALYADVPGLVPTRAVPTNHHYIGPILWSPQVDLPMWWPDLPEDRPCVYVTLGSSGQADLLPMVIDTLRELSVTTLVATAGRVEIEPSPGVFVARYLPGALAARRADLVICNGGSASAYQALSEGVPVLGIPSNLDQHLTMAWIEQAGAGLTVRDTKEAGLRRAIQYGLHTPSLKDSAARIAEEFSLFPAGERFAKLTESWLN